LSKENNLSIDFKALPEHTFKVTNQLGVAFFFFESFPYACIPIFVWLHQHQYISSGLKFEVQPLDGKGCDQKLLHELGMTY
jgi:hypothetical protein